MVAGDSAEQVLGRGNRLPAQAGVGMQRRIILALFHLKGTPVPLERYPCATGEVPLYCVRDAEEDRIILALFQGAQTFFTGVPRS